MTNGDGPWFPVGVAPAVVRRATVSGWGPSIAQSRGRAARAVIFMKVRIGAVRQQLADCPGVPPACGCAQRRALRAESALGIRGGPGRQEQASDLCFSVRGCHIPADDLVALIGTELADGNPPQNPAAADVATPIWDARRLTAAQVEHVGDTAKSMRQERVGKQLDDCEPVGARGDERAQWLGQVRAHIVPGRHDRAAELDSGPDQQVAEVAPAEVSGVCIDDPSQDVLHGVRTGHVPLWSERRSRR